MRQLVCLLCAAAALLAAARASGQSSALRDRFQSDGVILPPTGVALDDQGTAPEINPAGVALLAKPQLFYLHDRGVRNDHTTDAAFLGTGLFGWGGASVAMQWVRPNGAPSYRKTTFTLAGGGEFLSLGLNFNTFDSNDLGLDGLTSWDAGLTFHPWRYLALGAAVKDFDGPVVHDANNVQLPRRYDMGFAFRPFTDRIWLTGDFLIDDQGGLPGSVLNFSAGVEVADGIIISGALATGLHGGDVVGQVALTLNSTYVGATWAGGAGRDVGSNWQQTIQLRVSADRYRSLDLSHDRYLVLDLAAQLTPQRSTLASLVLPSTQEPYLELLALIDRIRRDRDVAGVLVKVSGLPDIGHARVEELRAELLGLRAAGKHVFAIFMDGGDDEYLLATAAERIWSVPQATFLVNGYTATATFLAGTLSKVGVNVDVARVGAYKSATDAFTRTDMSPEEKEVLDAWLDGLFQRTLASIEKARTLPEDKLKATIDQGILSAKGAKEAGLVDEVVYPDELMPLLQRGHGRSLDLVTEMPKKDDWPRRWGTRPRVALINVEGLIAEGKSRSDPFGLTRIAGAETVLRSLEKALDDPLTKAIVVRVDSGGGSGAASDLIWRAMMKVREYKPVVVSMGDVAASGGYYIAMAGERVYAEPSTLTGSIGVFAIKPSLGGLFEKIGVNQETLKRGDKADLFSLSRPWTEGEQAAMQRYVDEFYEQFVAHVAESRKLTKEQVDSWGRGRVFSGEVALKAGLVDELGGLSEAISFAKLRAGLKSSEVDVEILHDGGGMLEIFTSSQSDTQARAQIARLLGDAAAEVGVALELPNGPLAMMPYRVHAK